MPSDSSCLLQCVLNGESVWHKAKYQNGLNSPLYKMQYLLVSKWVPDGSWASAGDNDYTIGGDQVGWKSEVKRLKWEGIQKASATTSIELVKPLMENVFKSKPNSLFALIKDTSHPIGEVGVLCSGVLNSKMMNWSSSFFSTVRGNSQVCWKFRCCFKKCFQTSSTTSRNREVHNVCRPHMPS